MRLRSVHPQSPIAFSIPFAFLIPLIFLVLGLNVQKFVIIVITAIGGKEFIQKVQQSLDDD